MSAAVRLWLRSMAPFVFWLSFRFLQIHFRLLSFDNFSQHVGHFWAVIPTHTTVFHLSKVISDRTSIIMPQEAVIFTDKSRDPKSILVPDLTLEECGFEGGSSNFPKELLLYYDYAVEMDCPLLMSDHYLAYKAKTLKHRDSFQIKHWLYHMTDCELVISMSYTALYMIVLITVLVLFTIINIDWA